MSERIVTDPSQHGWVEVDGKWVWEGGATTGHIEDGTIEGQVTTWDVAKTEWTPDSNLIIDAAGDATFSGTISADKSVSADWYFRSNSWRSKAGGKVSLYLGGDSIYPTNYIDNPSTGISDGEWSLGTPSSKFKSAYFSGTVTSATTTNQTGAQYNGYNLRKADGAMVGSIVGLTADNDNGCLTLYKGGTKGTEIRADGPTYFGGTVDAAGFTVNGSPISGGGGLPDGGYTYGWSITASDFIATSDERLKKNVCTAPTGVLEKIRGVEFEWKASGQLSSGVIAQELEAVPELAHLVHTGEEDGTKHVSYLGLIGYLVEEVKALRAEVEELKS